MIEHKAPPSDTPAIEVNHLTVSYGPVPALLDVSLKVPKLSLIHI